MKKGFTLAELLGVIVIIALLLLLIIPIIMNGIKNRQGDTGDLQESFIYEAAGQFVDLDKDKYPNNAGDVYCVTFDELNKYGLIENSVLDVAKEYKKDSVVRIKVFEGGKKTYEIVDKNDCKEFTGNSIKIVVSPSNNKWSKSKQITITYPTVEGNYNKQYKLNDGLWTNYTEPITVDKNSSIEARLVDSNNQTLVSKKGNALKIDTKKPVVDNINLDRPWNDDLEQQVDITVSDADSGVAAYCIKQDPNKPESNDECWVNYRTPAYGGKKTFSNFLKQGTYYIFVKDVVGHISDTDDKNGSFKVEDSVPPTCTIEISGTKGTNNWYTSKKVTATINTSDDKSGVKDYDLTTSGNPSYNKNSLIELTEDTAGVTYYGYVRDRAGNINTCSTTVKKDSTEPTCTLQQSGAQSNGWYTGNVSVSWVNKYDSLSQIAAYDIIANSNAPYSYYNRDSILHTGDTAGTYYYGYVKDNAGNVGRCSSSIIRKDTDYPTCTLTVSSSGKLVNGWYNDDVTVSFASKSDATGVTSYGITNSTSASYNGRNSVKHTSDTTGVTYYGYVKDGAGHTGRCQTTFKMDATPPKAYVQIIGDGQIVADGNNTNVYANGSFNDVTLVAAFADYASGTSSSYGSCLNNNQYKPISTSHRKSK